MNTPSTPTKAALAGDQEKWFLREVHPHEQPLRAWLVSHFPAVSDIDDVVQESYLRLWRGALVRPVSSAKSFLFTVARNVALDQLRRQQIAPIVAAEAPEQLECAEADAGGVDQLVHKERIEMLADALVSLSPKMRKALILHKLENLRQVDVALAMSVTQKAVENYVRRGLEKCRSFFKQRLRHES